MWSARGPYVGDSSKVVVLVSEAGFGPAQHKDKLAAYLQAQQD